MIAKNYEADVWGVVPSSERTAKACCSRNISFIIFFSVPHRPFLYQIVVIVADGIEEESFPVSQSVSQ